MPTYNAKPDEIERRWFIVDATGLPVGRAASKIAKILQGKTKPQYTPHCDVGDFVVVINAEKIKLTGRKLDQKKYYNYSGHVGGLRTTTARELLRDKPVDVLKLAVKGMLPRSRMGRAMLDKLKLHKGACPAHGYTAQKAEPLTL